MTSPGVTFCIFIDGELFLQESAIAADDLTFWEWLKKAAERHGEICADADNRGRKYMVEVQWWDGERTRWGTDVDGMTIPVEVGIEQLADEIGKRWQR
jgi:hypothetical protein